MLKTPSFLARRLTLTVGIGFALSLLLMATLTWVALEELASTDERMKRIVRENSVKSQLANQMRDLVRDRAISMLSIVVMSDPFQKDAEMLRFYNLGSRYQSTRVLLEPMLDQPEEIQVLARIDRITRINQPLMVRTVDLGMEGYTFLAFEVLQNEGIPMQRQLVTELDTLIDIQREATRQAGREAAAAYIKTRWLMLALGLAAAAIGILVALLVIGRTARLAAETERERTKFQTLFETNTDGIVILDKERFTECNPAMLEMFRCADAQDFLALRPEDLGVPLQPEGGPAWETARLHLTTAMLAGHDVFTWQGRRRDGSQFPAEVALHAMKLNGQTYIQAIIRDITTQKEAEAALKAAHDAALATADLKTQFVANVSHEIRTPMNGIIGMTRLLLRTELSSRQREYADSVAHSAEALLRIINDLLDFSKIEAGRLEVEEIVFDLPALLKDLMELFQHRAAAKGLRFHLDTAPGMPAWVVGDPLRIRQVLLNLLDNALKFTQHGGIRLSVAPLPLTALGHAPAYWRFSVLDTGIGIPDEAMHRIFQAFSQADGSTSRKFGGTGLGLAICRQLSQLMGGELTAESQAGCGSAFHLDLPLRLSEHPPAQEEETAVAPPRLAPATVLVADDNPVNQKLSRFMLENLGLAVELADDGKQAYDRLCRGGIDLVLMDCQMPEWDGLMASRAVRAWEQGQGSGRVPIVALTANAMAGFDAVCRAAGMDDYLAKPLREEDLHALLERWLPRQPALPDTRPAPAAGQPESGPRPSTTDTTAVIPFDLPKLRRVCRDDPARVAEMLRLFIDSTADLLATLAQAVESGEARQAARQAHQIKGAAAYLGAEEFTELASQVEHAAKEADGAALPALVDDLQAGFIHLRLAMQSYLEDDLAPQAQGDATPPCPAPPAGESPAAPAA